MGKKSNITAEKKGRKHIFRSTYQSIHRCFRSNYTQHLPIPLFSLGNVTNSSGRFFFFSSLHSCGSFAPTLHFSASHRKEKKDSSFFVPVLLGGDRVYLLESVQFCLIVTRFNRPLFPFNLIHNNFRFIFFLSLSLSHFAFACYLSTNIVAVEMSLKVNSSTIVSPKQNGKIKKDDNICVPPSYNCNGFCT